MEFWIKIASPRMIVNQCFAWLPSNSFFNSIDPKRTPAGINYRIASGSFDHLVSTTEERRRNS